MKTIIEAKKNIALLWRNNKPKHTIYRPMQFLLNSESEDGVLLYNIVTSEMVLLEGHEVDVFKSLPTEYEAEMDELISRHFIVPADYDEKKFVNNIRQILRKIESPKRISGYTILPTTECNARCYYCFESDHKRCTMTDAIVKDVVEYIAAKGKGEPVELSWFGGEPLVAHKRISQIIKGLKKRGIKYTSSMVSNGYLFDHKLIQVAKNDWHLNNVQITIDGTESIYNKTKAYINPKDNPFLRVLRNINDLLANEIAVNVRLNVTDKNAANLNELIKILDDRFHGIKGFSCYSHAVYEDVGFEPLNYDDNIREFIDLQTISLDTKLIEKGLLGGFRKLPSLRIKNCMADNDACRLIYPDGIIGRCENKSSSDGIGNIYNDITDFEMDNLYKEGMHFSYCNDCWLYPNCINLKLCPETGKCTKSRLEWKRTHYCALMEEKYSKYKQKDLVIKTDENSPNECDS